MRSVRTLLWSVEANWGDTGSSPLPSVVALGSVTVAITGGDGGMSVEANWGDTGSSPLLSVVALGSVTVAITGGDGGVEMGRVSASSTTLTWLLMVSSILSTFTGNGACDRASFVVASLEAYVVAIGAMAVMNLRGRDPTFPRDS